MYFIVRTDVTKDSGLQRVFGAFDTQEEADLARVQIEEQRVGTFKTYHGEPVE